jgi:hypothetical protein
MFPTYIWLSEIDVDLKPHKSFASLKSRKYVEYCSKEKEQRILFNRIRTNIHSMSFSLKVENKLKLLPAFGWI